MISIDTITKLASRLQHAAEECAKWHRTDVMKAHTLIIDVLPEGFYIRANWVDHHGNGGIGGRGVDFREFLLSPDNLLIKAVIDSALACGLVREQPQKLLA